MAYAFYIKEIGRGKEDARDLSEDEAYHLFAALLDGGVPEMEMGAILMALRMKGESLAEMLGFHRAVEERTNRLEFESAVRPVVVASYSGARYGPNLLPLVAMLLTRLGTPVLIHGVLQGEGRVATVYVLRELGILPSVSLGQAQSQLEAHGLAFVPTQTFAPGLASLLALRGRLGVRNAAHTLVKLMNPFAGEGVIMASASQMHALEIIREFMVAAGSRGLLMQGTEGEAFANPKRRPRIEFFVEGQREVLFEEELGPLVRLPSLPPGIDASNSAAWIRRALAGEVPVPLPILHQLACCLFASGYSDTMHEAKAVVAVATRRLSVA